MTQKNKIKIVGRFAALGIMLISMTGPWLFDSHPATQETCIAPLVWLGNGSCACLVSLLSAFWVSVSLGQGLYWLLCLIMAVPLLSTILLLVGRERRLYWIINLTVWGLAAGFSLFLFVGSWYSHRALILWGAGLYGAVALTVLVGELQVERHNPAKRVNLLPL